MWGGGNFPNTLNIQSNLTRLENLKSKTFPVHVSSALEKLVCAFFISPDSEHFQTPECCLTLWGEGRSVLRGLGLEDSGTLKSTSWSISAVCHEDIIMMTNENYEEGQQKAVPKCEVAFPVNSQSSICHNSKLWRASERASEHEKKDKGCYDLCVCLMSCIQCILALSLSYWVIHLFFSDVWVIIIRLGSIQNQWNTVSN